MATTKFYFDTRNNSISGLYPLKISLSQQGQTTYIPLEIKLTTDQCSKLAKNVIKHSNRLNLNDDIPDINSKIEAFFFKYAAKIG